MTNGLRNDDPECPIDQNCQYAATFRTITSWGRALGWRNPAVVTHSSPPTTTKCSPSRPDPAGYTCDSFISVPLPGTMVQFQEFTLRDVRRPSRSIQIKYASGEGARCFAGFMVRRPNNAYTQLIESILESMLLSPRSIFSRRRYPPRGRRRSEINQGFNAPHSGTSMMRLGAIDGMRLKMKLGIKRNQWYQKQRCEYVVCDPNQNWRERPHASERSPAIPSQ